MGNSYRVGCVQASSSPLFRSERNTLLCSCNSILFLLAFLLVALLHVEDCQRMDSASIADSFGGCGQSAVELGARCAKFGVSLLVRDHVL